MYTRGYKGGACYVHPGIPWWVYISPTMVLPTHPGYTSLLPLHGAGPTSASLDATMRGEHALGSTLGIIRKKSLCAESWPLFL